MRKALSRMIIRSEALPFCRSSRDGRITSRPPSKPQHRLPDGKLRILVPYLESSPSSRSCTAVKRLASSSSLRGHALGRVSAPALCRLTPLEGRGSPPPPPPPPLPLAEREREKERKRERPPHVVPEIVSFVARAGSTRHLAVSEPAWRSVSILPSTSSLQPTCRSHASIGPYLPAADRWWSTAHANASCLSLSLARAKTPRKLASR